jgi:hypothetical protein
MNAQMTPAGVSNLRHCVRPRIARVPPEGIAGREQADAAGCAVTIGIVLIISSWSPGGSQRLWAVPLQTGFSLHRRRSSQATAGSMRASVAFMRRSLHSA